MSSRVRPAEARDADAWIRLRSALWPESAQDHPPEIAAYFADPPEEWVCLVGEVAEVDEVDEVEGAADGAAVLGFVEVGLRPSAEGCTTSPVGYLEGIYVVPERRREGLAAALVAAAEAWARGRGCSEMASDRAPDNEASGRFHEGVGFSEVGRIVCYRKAL